VVESQLRFLIGKFKLKWRATSQDVALFYPGEDMKKILFSILLAMAAVTQVYADDIKISNAWARATAPGQDSASIQLTITSKKGATLVGVASGSAQSGEIHNMVVENGVMQMRALEELALPAKTPVKLGEDENHLMLIGLRNPLKAGHKLPFALTVKLADGKILVLKLLANIKPLATRSDAGH
jgi:copper(I)-binding protein